jgi:acetyltransferase-like isoleucine patch superfamily enzyme
MDFKAIFTKILNKTVRLIMFIIFKYPRIVKYKILSFGVKTIGNPKIFQPVHMYGKGKVIFKEGVYLGSYPSHHYFNGYIYIDVRNKESIIKFGKNVRINNNCSFISERKGINIGDNVLIGTNVEIIDSDFHNLDPNSRLKGIPKSDKVLIENNVFIGSNVKIMKGVTVGENSVIANSSVVIKSIVKNTIVGGNPAKIIGNL